MNRLLVEGTSAPSDFITRDRLLRLSQVMDLVAFGKTHIYAMAAAGTFPAPIRLGGKASRWSENEVLAWIATFTSGKAN